MRILVRLALWPVRIALTVLEWAVLFVTHFVGIGCYLMAGFCFLVAVTGWLMGLAPVEETLRTMGIGFGFFAVPHIVERIIGNMCQVFRSILEMGF